jgi:hypothetical protein
MGPTKPRRGRKPRNPGPLIILPEEMEFSDSEHLTSHTNHVRACRSRFFCLFSSILMPTGSLRGDLPGAHALHFSATAPEGEDNLANCAREGCLAPLRRPGPEAQQRGPCGLRCRRPRGSHGAVPEKALRWPSRRHGLRVSPVSATKRDGRGKGCRSVKLFWVDFFITHVAPSASCFVVVF